MIFSGCAKNGETTYRKMPDKLTAAALVMRPLGRLDSFASLEALGPGDLVETMVRGNRRAVQLEQRVKSEGRPSAWLI